MNFFVVRSKMFSVKCGDDIENKLNGISKSQSKHIKLKKCLDGEAYQIESNNYFFRSINHEIYLQEVKKSTISIVHDRRNCLSDIESLPWN